MSVKSTLKFLSDFEEKYGSVGKGIMRSMFEKSKTPKYSKFVQDVQTRAAIYSFKNGLIELPDRILNLLQQASNVTLIQEPCKRLVFNLNKKPKVYFFYLTNLDHNGNRRDGS